MPFPDDPLGIDCIHERLDRRFEKISFCDFNHYNFNNTMSAARQLRAGGCDSESSP